MRDKQNKGIGQYKDRPGYFWGGLVGGAILGALVNKMQGKDWKRGAMWGGITGGLGSAFVGPGAKTAAGTGWLDKMAPGITKSIFNMGAGNPALFGSTLGAAGAWMAGDPKKTRSDYEEWKAEEEAKRRAEQLKSYKYWHTNPWASGGMINARKGFYNGGGAWSGVASDEEIPGSEQDKILSITGQGGIESLGGLEDILETLEMSSGPGQGDMSGWYEMYEDLKGKGELPDWMNTFEMFMQNLDTLDISPMDFSKADPQTQGRFPMVGGEMAAEGGYKKKPQYAGGGIGDLDMTGGGASVGPGTGTSDDIPAMLSDGEFVVTAKAVKNLGGGDRMLGAKKMYSMMNQLDPDSQTPAEMKTVGTA